jgi:hypothetical protein
MALKGIDAQMMVTQTTEASRESSRLAYRGELAQDYLGVQARIENENNQERVARAIKSERTEFHPDDGGSGGGEDVYYGGADGGEDEEGEPPDGGEDYLVPAEEHIIDIRI